ncbi:uncharacterized protein [Elaeis guineensis]
MRLRFAQTTKPTVDPSYPCTKYKRKPSYQDLINLSSSPPLFLSENERLDPLFSALDSLQTAPKPTPISPRPTSRLRGYRENDGFSPAMTPRAVNSRHAVEACTLQLHAWKPFQLQTLGVDPSSSKPYPFHAKKPCRPDRSTAPIPTTAADSLDLSRLSLFDDPPPRPREESFRWLARKRRRRGSRSVSGRSSDRSGTRRRGSASAAYATCSDFPLAAGGTDSSGELFLNGDGSWGSDVSEARISRKESREVAGGAGLERDSSGFGSFQGGGGSGALESQGNESGYGSEPGYRGDGEHGYDDEFDEEDEDGRQLFWGKTFGGENNFAEQKTHHRGRRKKHDCRTMVPLR